MIKQFLDLDDLRVLIESELLNDSELDLIQRVLKFLFDQEDEFNAYCDTFTRSELYDKELQGTLFPTIWPFLPFIWFDDILHEKIIAYMLLANIGCTVIPVHGSFKEFNPFIHGSHGMLRGDVIRLVDAENKRKTSFKISK